MVMRLCSHITNVSAIANVRGQRDDFALDGFQYAAMAKRPRKPRLDQYDRYRAASGWWLAAWRDYKGLTLEELADEANTSKGMVSDLETGAMNSKGDRAQRFNRDWIDRFAKALGVTGGHLIDINPYTLDENETAWTKVYQSLSPGQRQLALDLVQKIAESKVG